MGVQPLVRPAAHARRRSTRIARPSIVLSFDAWQRLFGDDRRVLGKTLDLNGIPRYDRRRDAARLQLSRRAERFLDAVRISTRRSAPTAISTSSPPSAVSLPGATLEQARAEMVRSSRLGSRATGRSTTRERASSLQPLRDTIVGDARAATAACSWARWRSCCSSPAPISATCCSLARPARRREIAVRQRARRRSAGESRGSCSRRARCSPLVGGVAGLARRQSISQAACSRHRRRRICRAPRRSRSTDACWCSRSPRRWSPACSSAACPRGSSRAADRPTRLREGARGSSGSQWARNALVVSELALAMILLTGAGLLLRSFDAAAAREPGRAHRARAHVFASRRGSADPTFFPATLERIRALPGVRSVAIVEPTCRSADAASARGSIASIVRCPTTCSRPANAYRVVSPDYFATVGHHAAVWAVVSTTQDRPRRAGDRRQRGAGEEVLSGREPARQTGLPRRAGQPPVPAARRSSASLRDTRDVGLGSDPIPTVYIPLAVMPTVAVLLVSSCAPPATRRRSIAVDSRDHSRARSDAFPCATCRRSTTSSPPRSRRRAGRRRCSACSRVVALVMATLGVFGVLSFIVTQRTRELGIRIALGASSTSVRRLVVRPRAGAGRSRDWPWASPEPSR